MKAAVVSSAAFFILHYYFVFFASKFKGHALVLKEGIG
ncbi:hypothetical protein GLIP_3379 [Aliiglaciecola lipolytica E3]|uniref:Uncharacterized protein n=1 Tax=Aliiglaciecola lipolytica E3 TaxID=1127673 RepID=K6YH96_9ALTE|nr:hypothetical protein GLIP_3379 [Aliiglaciecola lipolytica E3]